MEKDINLCKFKGNLTKMNQLSFNKVVQFKTLSLYPTPVQLVQNSRKKKE